MATRPCQSIPSPTSSTPTKPRALGPGLALIVALLALQLLLLAAEARLQALLGGLLISGSGGGGGGGGSGGGISASSCGAAESRELSSGLLPDVGSPRARQQANS